MPLHVALIKRRFGLSLLDGSKTVECRLTRTARQPYRNIFANESIYFKQTGGFYLARARVQKILFFDDLNPKKIAQLKKKYNCLIGADDAYWENKMDAKYASLIFLKAIEQVHTGPSIERSQGNAWFILPDAAIKSSTQSKARARLCDSQKEDLGYAVEITAGAIRNGYLRVPLVVRQQINVSQVVVILPNNEKILTEVVQGRIRWRGWTKIYHAHQIKPKDDVFLSLTDQGLRICFDHRARNGAQADKEDSSLGREEKT